MCEDLATPLAIRHVGPVVLVESGRILQQPLVYVEDGIFFRQIEPERFPRNCKILVAHSEKAAKRQYSIGNTAACRVRHYVFDIAQTLVLRVNYTGTDYGLLQRYDLGISDCPWLCHFVSFPR